MPVNSDYGHLSIISDALNLNVTIKWPYTFAVQSEE